MSGVGKVQLPRCWRWRRQVFDSRRLSCEMVSLPVQRSHAPMGSVVLRTGSGSWGGQQAVVWAGPGQQVNFAQVQP